MAGQCFKHQMPHWARRWRRFQPSESESKDNDVAACNSFLLFFSNTRQTCQAPVPRFISLRTHSLIGGPQHLIMSYTTCFTHTTNTQDARKKDCGLSMNTLRCKKKSLPFGMRQVESKQGPKKRGERKRVEQTIVAL